MTRVKSHPALLHELERVAKAYRGKRTSRAAVEIWADLLTDRARLLALLRGAAEMPISERDVIDAHRIMTDRVAAVLARDPREGVAPKPARKKRRAEPAEADPDTHWTAIGLEHKPGQRTVDDLLPEGIRKVEALDLDDDDENVRGETGIDGLRTEDDVATLDLDDWPFCCARTSWSGARTIRSRTCSSTRRRTCRP